MRRNQLAILGLAVLVTAATVFAAETKPLEMTGSVKAIDAKARTVSIDTGSATDTFKIAPSDAIGTGLILYEFRLDKPHALGPEVTARDVAFELDWYLDWKVNQNFTFSFVGAYANPGLAVQQGFDRTEDFAYGMIFVGYSY